LFSIHVSLISLSLAHLKNNIIMGKGDKRSRKGKIWKGSYGVSRKRKKKHDGAFKASPAKSASKKAAPATEEAEAKTKKAPAKKAAPKKKAEPAKPSEE
jgi:30S ribosomal protein S31